MQSALQFKFRADYFKIKYYALNIIWSWQKYVCVESCFHNQLFRMHFRLKIWKITVFFLEILITYHLRNLRNINCLKNYLQFSTGPWNVIHFCYRQKFIEGVFRQACPTRAESIGLSYDFLQYNGWFHDKLHQMYKYQNNAGFTENRNS